MSKELLQILYDPDGDREACAELDRMTLGALHDLRHAGYGRDVVEVAEYLIKRGVDDLKRTSVLKLERV